MFQGLGNLTSRRCTPPGKPPDLKPDVHDPPHVNLFRPFSARRQSSAAARGLRSRRSNKSGGTQKILTSQPQKRPPHLWALDFIFGHFWVKCQFWNTLWRTLRTFTHFRLLETFTIFWKTAMCYTVEQLCFFWRNRNLLLTKQKLPSESQHCLGINCICSVNPHIRFLIHKRLKLNDCQWQGSTLKIAYC